MLGNRAPELRPDTPSQTRAHAELAIFAHALLRVASSADGVIVGLYLAALNREYGRIHAGLVGTLGAAAYGAELMASVPLGLAADAFSVRGLMAAGALVSALGTQLFAVAVSTPVFFLSRLLQGVGIAGVTPPLLKFLAQSTAHEPVRRARVMSFFELSMLAGLALGGVLGTQFWAALNAGAFSAVALLIVVCAVLLFLGAPRGSDPATTGATLQGLREVLSSRFVRRLAPIWVCVNAIVGLWLGPTLTFLLTEQPQSGQYLDGLFAAAPTDIGWLLLGYSAIFATGLFLWSLVLPKVRTVIALQVSLYAMFGVCLSLFATNHSAAWGSTGRDAILLVTALLIMVESGFTPAALTWLAQSLEPVTGKGAAMGIYSLLLGLGAVGGSLLAAALGSTWQLDGLLLGTLLLAGIALVLLYCLPPQGTEGARSQE